MQTKGTNVGSITLKHDGDALGKYLRVKWTGSGTALNVAAAAEEEIGTLTDNVLSGDDYASVTPRTAPVCKMVAGAAIGKGAAVYGSAGGKVDAVSTSSVSIGVALEAATADGDIIQVMRIQSSVVPAVS